MRPSLSRIARRWWLWPGIVALLAAAFGTWLLVRAVQVKGDLEAARSELRGVELDIRSVEDARARLDAAAPRTASARVRTTDPLWHLGERLPLVGDDLAAVRTLAAAVDTVVAEVAPPVLKLAESLDPQNMRREDGSLDLSPLTDAQDDLEAAETAAEAADAQLRALDRDGLVAPVGTAVDQASTQFQDLLPMTQGMARAARLLPPMLGSEEPRRYFLAFQNPAEARGTGGIVGIYGILQADAGRMSMVEMGANDDLMVLDAPPVDLGEEYHQLYGTLTRDSDNANLSPHFPYAARNLLGLWSAQTGEQLDGVLAVDPVAMEHLLEVVGPTPLPTGEEVSAGDVVQLTLSEVYHRFPDDQRARRQFLGGLVGALLERLTDPGTDPVKLAEALREPASEHRVMVYSAEEHEQRDLEQTSLAGALPPADGAYRGVVINNAGANKLDYYLDRTVRYLVGCTDGGRTRTRLQVSLHNDAPAHGLARYVTSHVPELEEARSTNRSIVSAFLPAPTGVERVTVDGVPVGTVAGSELGYNVFAVTVDVPAGATVEVEWTLDEPSVPAGAGLFEQPLVRPLEQDVEASCDRRSD